MNGERTLGVWLERQHIGSIVHVPPEKGDMSVFLLDESYRQNPERPVLSLSFAADNGMLAYAPRYINTRVHSFFSNLLPEGRLRDYLAHKSGVKPQREFNLLAALGEDLPGGVVVLPESEQMAPDLGHGQDVSLPTYQEGETLKFSLAGVQIKMSAVENARGGLTIPAYGRGGSWIVKLPSTHFESVPENEFTMMRLADQLGLSVPKMHLLPVMDVEGLPKGMRRTENLFAIQRFDRDAHGGRIHMEDFAQVFGLYPEQKYHKASYYNIAEVLLRTGGLSTVQDFIRRITFMTAIGNGDMHLKNWSLLYPDGKHPELSPVYDMLSTLPYVSKRENMGLSFAKSKDFQDYSSSRITLFAERLGIEPSLLLAPAKHLAEAFPDVWSDLKRDAPMPAYMQEMVDTHVRSIALFQEVHPSLFSVRQGNLDSAQSFSTHGEIPMSSIEGVKVQNNSLAPR
jgi:serine/threonine-protein kinase HipA